MGEPERRRASLDIDYTAIWRWIQRSSYSLLAHCMGTRFCLLILFALVGSSYGASIEPGALPDASLTPGAALEVAKDDVCTAGYTKNVRNVPVALKRLVFEGYGIKYVPRAYEVDHLIALELGGSNSIRNLWPESYSLVWNAHVKDALEGRLQPTHARQSKARTRHRRRDY